MRNFSMPVQWVYGLCLLPLGLSCLALPAEAGAAPAFCVGFKNFVYATIENTNASNERIDCQDLKAIDDSYSGLCSIIPPGLDNPKVRVANMVLPAIEGFSTLSMNFALGFNKGDRAEMDAILKIFAHEVGHQIFDHYLLLSTPELIRINSMRRDSLEFFATTYAPLMRRCAKRRSISEMSETCYGRAAKAIAKEILQRYPHGTPADVLNREEDNLVVSSDDWNAIESPYDELFADVTAAVYYENPEIMASGMGILQHTPPLSCRSFSEKIPEDFASPDPHCELSKIRISLWQDWIQPRMKDKKALLASLAKVLIANIDWRLQSHADTEAALSHLRQSLGLPDAQ